LEQKIKQVGCKKKVRILNYLRKIDLLVPLLRRG